MCLVRVEDAQSLGSVAFEKVQTLRGVGVDILLGMAFSSHLQLAASYVNDNNMLVISHGSQAANLAIDDNMFRLVPNDGNQALAVAAMIEDAGVEVLLFVTRNDVWGEGLRDSVVEIYDGTIVEGIRYSPDANEFSAEVSIIDEIIGELVAEHGADKVGVLYIGTDEFVSIIQQMRFYENVDDVRWFTTNTHASKQIVLQDDLVDFVEKTMLTATLTKSAESNHITEHVKTFVNDTYGENPNVYSYGAYDSVWLLGSAILQANSAEVDDLIVALPLVAEHMIGAGGPLRLTDKGDLAHAEYDILQVRNGEWVFDAEFDSASGSIIRSTTP